MLSGRTERGQAVELLLRDGKLHSLRTRAPVYCPEQRVWRSIRWTPVAGLFGVFVQDGSSFRVRQRADARRTASKTADLTVIEMRGRLGDDGASAHGSIVARWRWERFTCRGSVRFRAG